MALGLIEDFHKEAAREGLDYLIIGGYAASYWGTPRFTADVDYAIRKEQFPRAKDVAAKLGYRLLFLHPKEAFAHFAPVDSNDRGMRLDLMLVDESTWSQLKSQAVDADIGGPQPYKMVGVLHLIAMKLHAAKQPDRLHRQKDIYDIVEVMENNNLSYDDLDKAGILTKHGTEETLAQLRSLLRSR